MSIILWLGMMLSILVATLGAWKQIQLTDHLIGSFLLAALIFGTVASLLDVLHNIADSLKKLADK